MRADTPPEISAVRLALMGLGGFGTLGALVGALTVGINPHLHASRSDSVRLILLFTLAYGAVGVLAGGFTVLFDRLVGQWLPVPVRSRGQALALAALVVAPISYALLLPDLGLFTRLLTDARSRPGRLALIGLAISVAVVLGAAAGGRAAADLRRSGRRVTTVLVVGWLATLGLLVTMTVVATPSAPAPVSEARALRVVGSEERIDPVLLLCIDGMDLDDVALPLAEAGRLPTLARLLREGTWGPLATLEPTLSPVVWTTLITGRPPAAHGIWHFMYVRLPGIESSIGHFPVHTGLNFKLFPLLADLGLPRLHHPTTSSMRRARALWSIVGDHYPVGAYRWLMSWPAEEVNGFDVAGGPAWLDPAASRPLSELAVYPPELRSEIVSRPGRLDASEYAPYSQSGSPPEPQSTAARAIEYSLRDRTADLLPTLIERYETRFTAAAFYPVDAYHHLFAEARRAGGPFAPAIDAAYEHTDRRLGELLTALPERTNVIIVSDHGFDFDNLHHTWSPPGLFIAHGPAFAAGRRVDSLSVYDIAPLVLHLVGLPLADDMPGTTRGTYRHTLADPPTTQTTIPTYETGRTDDTAPELEIDRDEELEKLMKSLGYVN